MPPKAKGKAKGKAAPPPRANWKAKALALQAQVAKLGNGKAGPGAAAPKAPAGGQVPGWPAAAPVGLAFGGLPLPPPPPQKARPSIPRAGAKAAAAVAPPAAPPGLVNGPGAQLRLALGQPLTAPLVGLPGASFPPPPPPPTSGMQMSRSREGQWIENHKVPGALDALNLGPGS